MMIRCPNCVLHVRKDAVKCPHCGIYLSRSLKGLVSLDPATAPYRLYAWPAEKSPSTKRSHRFRSAAALLAIASLFLLTWSLERRKADPAAHPLPVTFEEFERLFGAASALMPEEKEQAFDRYRGKYVRWEGTVLYLNNAEASEPHVSINHGKETTPASDVTFYVRPKDRSGLDALRVGDRLRYVGSLAGYGPDGAPVVIQDGRIIK